MLRDQAGRDKIVEDLESNMMVLAGAGAGKTYSLVQRMTRCVLTGHARVEHMAAITFTRKAAGEMRERFVKRLHAIKAEVEGEEAARVREALANIDQCFLGTIHSFCGRLLRERPIEAGLPPDFTEVEEREATVLGREAWDLFVQQRYADDDPRLEFLEECGLTTEDLYDFFQVRCGLSDVALKLEDVPCPDLKSVVDEACTLVEEARAHIPATSPKGPDDMMTLCQSLPTLLSYHDLSRPAACAEVLRYVQRHLDIKVTYWAEGREEITRIRDEVVPVFKEKSLEPALRQWRQHIYPTAASFVEDAVHTFAEERRRRGTLTFFDLLVFSKQLLQDHPEVRRALQKHYRVLFVDEFQDTDPIQAEVLLYLTGSDVEERDWTRLVPRPGSLFVVGDAKQSIYRFRRADLGVFRFVERRIRETGGTVVHLNTSFRSLGNLCAWFNGAFPDCFRAHDEDYQAHFEPLYKYRPEGEDPLCVRTAEIPKIHRSPVDEIVREDAARIADFIVAAMAGETQFNAESDDGEGALLGRRAEARDFMILTRRKKNLSSYARELEARGIPFDIVGGARLGESKELRALVEVLEAVAAPENPLPVLGVLRGPLTGLADDELYAFRKAGGAFDYRTDVPAGVSGPLAARIDRAFKIIRGAEKLLFTLVAPAAVERILERLGLIPFSSLRPMGSSRAGNLLRILALVRQWCDQGMHWLDVTRELRALIDDEDYSLEEMTLESGRKDVVRLMNVHQAKGLQARVVFLADPYSRSANKTNVSMHVSRVGGEPYLSIPVTRSKGTHYAEVIAEPVGWEEDRADEERYCEAEEMRLRYVAATRACNLLVVSRYGGNSRLSPWAPLYPCLEDVPSLEALAYTSKQTTSLATYDVDALREQRKIRWENIRQPTYHETSVSGTQEELEATVQQRVVDGKGAAYGRVVHDVFDAAVRGVLPEDEEVFIEALIEEHDAPPDLVSAVQCALEGLRDSSLWALVQEAPEVYSEVPLAVRLNGATETVQRGQIDLVLKGPGGWMVVDYKTDRIGSDGDANRIVERYREQVATYAAHWEGVTGEKVIRQGIWLAGSDKLVSIV